MKIFGRKKQGFLTKKNFIKISVKLWETDKIIFCFFKVIVQSTGF